MPAFQISADIGNRALQHCGARRMDPVLGFSDGTPNAGETAYAYDKVREAELRRNIWVFAIKETVLRAIDSNAMLLAPSLWSSGVTYFNGSIVSDQNGNLWISNTGSNLGNDPTLTNLWEPYYGPMSVPLYDTTGSTAYEAGELVYTAPGDGTNRVYLSLISGNSDVPGTATQWASTTTYFKDQVVTFNSVAYMSLADLNTGNEPDQAPAAWSSATTYSSGQKVYGTDLQIYTSAVNSNLNHNPVGDGGTHWTATGKPATWTTSFVGGSGSVNWLEIGGSEFPNGVGLTGLNLIYPVGAGPSNQVTTRNVYRLPAGFLRVAPQTPKPGVAWLGGPTGNMYDDWAIENFYLTTMEAGPLRVRFVANVTDVSRMDPMFCEGLAARLGMEICERVTQSTARLQTIAKIYQQWMGEARTANLIETGYVDPPDDDWITVRY